MGQEPLLDPVGCLSLVRFKILLHGEDSNRRDSCSDTGLFGEWSTSFAILQNASSGHQNSCYSPLYSV